MSDPFIDIFFVGTGGIQSIIGADNGAGFIQVQQEIDPCMLRCANIVAHQCSQKIRGYRGIFRPVFSAGVIVCKDDIGGREHGIFFFFCPFLGGGGGDVSGGDIRGEGIAQGRQVIAIPQNDCRFFPLHHIIIDLTQCGIGIGYPFAVIMHCIQFVFGKHIRRNLDIPVGRGILIQIHTMVFHGDDMEEQTGFVGLLQLPDNFFCNGFISDVRTAVPVMLCMQVIFPQPGINAQKGICTVAFVEVRLIGMHAGSIIAQIFEMTGIGEDIFKYILLIGYIAGRQHICGHACQDFEFRADGAAAKGAGDHIAAGMFCGDTTVVFQWIFRIRDILQHSRIPIGFGKDYNDVGVLEILTGCFGRLIFFKVFCQIFFVIISRVSHVQRGKVQDKAGNEAVCIIVGFLIAGGFGGNAEVFISIADCGIHTEQIKPCQE